MVHTTTFKGEKKRWRKRRKEGESLRPSLYKWGVEKKGMWRGVCFSAFLPK